MNQTQDRYQKNQQCWKPTASLSMLKFRANAYKRVRDFFEMRQVLEVDVPILSDGASVDPFIDSLTTSVLNETCYLQTSPEFYLKRLLCAGSGDVYSLGKAFRQGEKGHRHQPEFTLLEWYRVGWDELRLMDEVADLIRFFLPEIKTEKISYRELFFQHLSIDPHQSTENELMQIVKSTIDIDIKKGDKNMWLDVLMTHCIEPQLPQHLFFVYDYPASQAALAKIDNNAQGQRVARRFEAYLNNVELVNGYFELTDADEQLSRFQQDLLNRKQNDLPQYPYDEKLLDAMKIGLPECAGVALGFDRLLMSVCGVNSIDNVMAFAK